MSNNRINQTVEGCFCSSNNRIIVGNLKPSKKKNVSKTKEWFELLKKECKKVNPGTLTVEGLHSFSVPSWASFSMDKAKVEIKLSTDDGTLIINCTD